MNKNNHEENKKRAMKSLEEALKRGEVDEPIIPYLNIINDYDELYTTSSCYGRITIDETPLKENKKEHDWLGKWHREVSKEEIENALKKGKKDIIWLKQDPFILHIGAESIEIAEKVLHAAREMTGLKRAGIMHTKPRIMLEIMGLDFLASPIIIKGKRIIEKNGLTYLVELANLKFKRNEERLKKFIDNLQKIMN